jgi:hypothetical protein
MMNTGAWHRSALSNRCCQSSQRQLGIEWLPDGVSDHLAATGMQNYRPVNKPFFDTNERHIRHPNRVWSIWKPIAVQIGAHRPVMLAIWGAKETALEFDPPTLWPHDVGNPLVMDALALCL